MKKPILLLITFFLSTTTLLVAQSNQQEKPKKQKFHEIGINITTFINEFVSLNNNDADLGNYMMTYKYHMGKNAIRVGLGGRFSQSDEPAGGGNRVSKENSLDLRVGYEWNKSIAKRWAFYYGLDAIGGSNSSVTIATNFEEVTTTDRTTYYGGGALIGVQFFINSHISLATESSLYFQHESITSKTEFSVDVNSNFEETKTNDFADFGVPTALFFVIRF